MTYKVKVFFLLQFQVALGDSEFDSNNVTLLGSLHARLKAAILVDIPFIKFSKISTYKFVLLYTRHFYGYWKEHIKDRCICCSSKIAAIEDRVLIPVVFREYDARRCCSK